MTQQDRIESTLSGVKIDIAKISKEMALINQRCKHRGEVLGKLNASVGGNGQPGMKLRLHDAEQDIKAIKQTYRDMKSFGRPILQKLITAALVLVVVGAWAVYQDRQFDKFMARLSEDPNIVVK